MTYNQATISTPLTATSSTLTNITVSPSLPPGLSLTFTAGGIITFTNTNVTNGSSNSKKAAALPSQILFKGLNKYIQGTSLMDLANTNTYFYNLIGTKSTIIVYSTGQNLGYTASGTLFNITAPYTSVTYPGTLCDLSTPAADFSWIGGTMTFVFENKAFDSSS
jgi:hypothetical protein